MRERMTMLMALLLTLSVSASADPSVRPLSGEVHRLLGGQVKESRIQAKLDVRRSSEIAVLFLIGLTSNDYMVDEYAQLIAGWYDHLGKGLASTPGNTLTLKSFAGETLSLRPETRAADWSEVLYRYPMGTHQLLRKDVGYLRALEVAKQWKDSLPEGTQKMIFIFGDGWDRYEQLNGLLAPYQVNEKGERERGFLSYHSHPWQNREIYVGKIKAAYEALRSEETFVTYFYLGEFDFQNNLTYPNPLRLGIHDGFVVEPRWRPRMERGWEGQFVIAFDQPAIREDPNWTYLESPSYHFPALSPGETYGDRATLMSRDLRYRLNFTHSEDFTRLEKRESQIELHTHRRMTRTGERRGY